MEQTFDTDWDQDQHVKEWVRHSSPAPGRNFTVLVESVGGAVRRMTDEALGAISERDAYQAVFGPRIDGLGVTRSDSLEPMLAARALVGTWLSAYALGAIGPDDSFAAAERWFVGRSGRLLPRLARRDLRPDASSLPSKATTFALLPYLLDRLAPGTRRSTMQRPDQAPDRRHRKERGVFYTPGDVAVHMALTGTPAEVRTCVDPCCGTGVFLRAMLLTRRCAFEGLFGLDIDPLAADACAFVLSAAVLADDEHRWPSPWAAWHSARSRLATGDSLLLMPGPDTTVEPESARTTAFGNLDGDLRAGRTPAHATDELLADDIRDVFPQLRDGAELVISNPPYAQLGVRKAFDPIGSHYATLGSTGPRRTTRIEGLFLELAWRLASPTGGFSLVLPLSVAANSGAQFVELRRALQRLEGSLQISFFDRAPDALFGDDVKTRNAIVSYRASEARGLSTTGLLRWTSGTRPRFFRSIQHHAITADIGPFIPKVGSRGEARLLQALLALPSSLGAATDRITTSRPGQEVHPAAVYVGPTAYNWLSCARSLRAFVDEGHSSESELTALEFGSTGLADAALAVLVGRVTFWLWRVEGDAFHVTRSFIQNLPFALHLLPASSLAEIGAVGSELWVAMREDPVVSVNKGRRTISFSSLAAPELVDAADLALARAFGFERALRGAAIRRWHENLVVVDFERDRAALLRKGQELAA